MKHIPNTLTIIRILVTPVLLVLLFTHTLMGYAWALALFVLASISDYLDGKLARHYEVGSRLGQFLDPLADKVLVLGTFVALIFIVPDQVPWWAVALIALRDVVVTGLRSWAEAQGRTLRTSKAAKIKTTFQLTFLISILTFLTASRLPDPVGLWARWVLERPVFFSLLMVVVLVTLATGVRYMVRLEYAEPEKEVQ